MSLPNRLKESLQDAGKDVQAPHNLKHKIMLQIEPSRGAKSMKKRIIAGLIAACLVIPTGTIAYQAAFHADELYGSFENVKRYMGTATIEGYMLFNAKLSQAKGDLGNEDYQEFKDLLKVITSSKLEYGDVNGNIDYDQVPAEKVAEIKEAMMVIQPFFDRLNGQVSSKEVLTAEEYEQYIESLMSYESIMVQSGINPSKSFELDAIKPVLLEDFKLASEFMRYVNEKQNDKAEEYLNPFPRFSINDQEVQIDYGVLSADSPTDNLSDLEAVQASTILKPIEVETNSSLSIAFTKPVDSMEIQLWNQDHAIEKNQSDSIVLPTKNGEYQLLIKAIWNEKEMKYIVNVLVQ